MAYDVSDIGHIGLVLSHEEGVNTTYGIGRFQAAAKPY